MNKRNFITKGIKVIAAIMSPGLIQAETQELESDKIKVKMLTREGKLVWVTMDKSEQEPSTPPVSNKTLYSWINPVKHESK